MCPLDSTVPFAVSAFLPSWSLKMAQPDWQPDCTPGVGRSQRLTGTVNLCSAVWDACSLGGLLPCHCSARGKERQFGGNLESIGCALLNSSSLLSLGTGWCHLEKLLDYRSMEEGDSFPGICSPKPGPTSSFSQLSAMVSPVL